MNDERDIVTAIDRNTKSIDRLYEALLKIVLHLIWIGVYLLLLCFLGLYIAKAAPLLTAAPEVRIKGVWRCPLK